MPYSNSSKLEHISYTSFYAEEKAYQNVATRLNTSQASGVSVPSQDHAGTHTVHNVYIQEFNHTALLIEIS